MLFSKSSHPSRDDFYLAYSSSGELIGVTVHVAKVTTTPEGPLYCDVDDPGSLGNLFEGS